MYTTGVFPLLHVNEMSNEINERTKRVAFVDDFTGSGKLQELRSWWDSIVSHGLNISYYPNVIKSWLTIKQQYFDDAIKIFEDTGVIITMKGRRHLGAIIGSKEYKRQYVSETDKVGYMKLSVCLISIKLFLMKHMLHLSSAFVFGICLCANCS